MALSILLVGAGGEALGQPLLKEFIKQKAFFKRVAVLTSSKNQVHRFDYAKEAGIEVIVGSLLDGSSYKGFDVVLSLLGWRAIRLQPAIIDVAVANGVTHFYPSEWNSDYFQPQISNMRYFRDKQVTRAHLVATAKKHENFKYTLFITGIFTEWTLLFGYDHDKLTGDVYGDPNNRIGFTSIPDMAYVTIQSLLIPFEANPPKGVVINSKANGERTIRVQGSTMRYGDLVATLESVRNVKYTINYHSPDLASKKEEQARLLLDEDGEMQWSITPLAASGYGVADGMGPLDNDKFQGFKPETAEETFRRVYVQG